MLRTPSQPRGRRRLQNDVDDRAPPAPSPAEPLIASYAQATGPVLTDPVTISLASGFNSMPLGASFDVVTSGANLELNYTAVPEPAHVLLLSCGALLTWLGIRRRFALACSERWSEPEA